MKRKLTKAEYDKLSDEAKANYKAVGSGYELDLEDDDTPDLIDKLKIETANRRKADKERKELQDRLDAIEEDKNKGKGDVAALEASWQKKLDKIEADKKAEADKHRTFVRNVLVDKVAADIAGTLSKTPKVLLPHVRQRLDVDFDGDEPKTVVLDGNGKRSAFTVDELTKEFRDNKDFAGIIVASQASGGSATRSGPTSGGGGASLVGSGNIQQPVSLSKLSAKDLAATIADQAKQPRAQRSA